MQHCTCVSWLLKHWCVPKQDLFKAATTVNGLCEQVCRQQFIRHRQSQPLQIFAEWNKQAFKFKTIAHIHSLYLQYGSSTLAHSNICSYSWAALSQLLSRTIPRDCRSANESGWFLYVSRACPSVAVKASTVQGEKVQPVPVTVTQNTTVLLDSRAILYMFVQTQYWQNCKNI